MYLKQFFFESMKMNFNFIYLFILIFNSCKYLLGQKGSILNTIAVFFFKLIPKYIWNVHLDLSTFGFMLALFGSFIIFCKVS